MIIKSLIAATALTASLMAFSPPQKAEAGVDINISVGFPGYYGYGSRYPIFNPRYSPMNCYNGKNIVRWSGFHKVNAIDCSLPAYKYTAWKSGHKFLVSVNRRGNVMSARKIF